MTSDYVLVRNCELVKIYIEINFYEYNGLVVDNTFNNSYLYLNQFYGSNRNESLLSIENNLFLNDVDSYYRTIYLFSYNAFLNLNIINNTITQSSSSSFMELHFQNGLNSTCQITINDNTFTSEKFMYYGFYFWSAVPYSYQNVFFQRNEVNLIKANVEYFIYADKFPFNEYQL